MFRVRHWNRAWRNPRPVFAPWAGVFCKGPPARREGRDSGMRALPPKVDTRDMQLAPPGEQVARHPLANGGPTVYPQDAAAKGVIPMKVTVEECSEVEQTEVTVRCKRMDAQTARLIELLRLADARLTGEKDGETCILDGAEVLYIDTVDRGTFLYTAGGVYETRLRLYELEGQLAGWDFVRVSKSVIVNFGQVKSLRPDFGGRLRLTMSNGEVVVANRQYVPAIKAKLGL